MCSRRVVIVPVAVCLAECVAKSDAHLSSHRWWKAPQTRDHGCCRPPLPVLLMVILTTASPPGSTRSAFAESSTRTAMGAQSLLVIERRLCEHHLTPEFLTEEGRNCVVHDGCVRDQVPYVRGRPARGFAPAGGRQSEAARPLAMRPATRSPSCTARVCRALETPRAESVRRATRLPIRECWSWPLQWKA